MKKIVAGVLAFIMLLSLPGCGIPKKQISTDGTAASREFTDSLGRTVEIPEMLTKVALSGSLSQIMLFALCPDKLIGLCDAWSEDAAQYLDEKYVNLPQIGQLYGGKSEMNPETLLAAGAEIVIDIGEAKDGMAAELDELQNQIGIPVVHISAATETYGEAYRTLGSLVGMPEAGETLAAYCEETYEMISTLSARVEKANVLYLTGENGLNVIAQGAYHAEIIDLLANNLAVLDEPSSKGTGNEVDMEQILNWNPDVIFFSPDSVYDAVAGDKTWQSISAIENGTYYEVPFGPYNWMGFPPSVQRYLGMLWMGAVLYPDAVDYDLQEAVTEYYRLFYHCELTDAQYDALTRNAL